MTDKQIIIDCKYKFQNNEKFEGKPYCTLHNELCEDLSFVCDNNCQIYDDYKQLKRKEQEYELLVRTNKIHVDMLDQLNNKYIDLEQECEKYEQALEEIRKIIASQDVGARPKLYDFEQDNKILDIIRKVKGE